MALIASGAPSRVLSRRNCAPRYNRLFVDRPFPITLCTLTRLSGYWRNQETEWFSVRHLLLSHPTSLINVAAVLTSTPPIWVRCVPHLRNSSACSSNCDCSPCSSGAVPSVSRPADRPLCSGLHSV